MPKPPREIAGFIALPVALKPDATGQNVKHFIYLKTHEPRVPTEDAARSLFLVNIPVTTTEAHLRNLFADQLGAGRVERVDFSDGTRSSSLGSLVSKSSKKRKRQTVEDLEAALEVYHLPSTYPSDPQVSGSTAIVTFVDRTSMELSMKATRRATKGSKELVWGDGLDNKTVSGLVGLQRYDAHNALQYPPRATLLSIVDNYMTGYSALEAARTAENARKRAAPDEDGFVTVTRGTRGGAVLRKEEAEDLKTKQTAKQKGLEDFYRFQMREKRKEQAGEFVKRFEEDKRKIQELRRRRGVSQPQG